MAGPYYTTIKSTSGEVINVYHPANAPVASYLNVEKNGGVTSTSEKIFTLTSPFTIDDLMTTVPDAVPAHQVEIVKNDEPKGRFFVLNAAMASTNSARKVQRLTLTPGQYKLMVRVAGPA